MPFDKAVKDISFEDPYWGPQPTDEPTFMASLKAAFRQDNLVGSVLASEHLAASFEHGFYDIDRSYNVFDDLTEYEHHGERFVHIFNARAAKAMKAQIDMEERDRRILAASGFATSLLTRGSAMVFDPTFYVGGAYMKGAKIGSRILKNAVRLGAESAALEAGHEAGLHATQALREGKETLVNVSGAAIFGALLGGGASAIMTKQAKAKASQLLEAATRDGFDQEADQLRRELEGVFEGHSLSAAHAPAKTLDDLSIAGNLASKVAKSTAGLNPLLRSLQSPSSLVRSTAARMMETPVYLKKTAKALVMWRQKRPCMNIPADILRARSKHKTLCGWKRAKVARSSRRKSLTRP